jgi:RND family efflux transporter MFP subunit
MKKASYLWVSILFIMLAACQEGPPKSASPPPVLTGIPVVATATTPVQEYYETSGTVMAKTIAPMASRLMGTVTALYVKEGDHVRAGQLLLTIDDQDMLQQMKVAYKGQEAAKEQRDLMAITAGRYEKLYAEKALTQQEMDEVATRHKVAQLEYDKARALAEEARIMFGYARITSPISGVITSRQVDLGATVVPGAPLLTVESTEAFQVEIHVDESLAGRLSPGMPVMITLEALGLQKEGEIQKIVSAVDPLSRSFLVKIDLADPGLRSGLFARVRIPTGAKNILAVPASSVVKRGQLTGLYIVDTKGNVSYRLIRLGKIYDQGVEVLSGLSPGERIVTAQVNAITDGARIK